MNTPKNSLVIYTSWQTYLWMLVIPLFLVGLDFISSQMTGTSFGGSILNAAIAIFLIMFVLGSKFVVLSKGSIKSWPSLVFQKKIIVSEISKVDINAKARFFFNTGDVIPSSVMYFKNSDSKILGKIYLAAYDKKSLARLLQRIMSINPRIVLNNAAKDLSGGDDALAGKQVVEMYMSLFRILVLMFVVILVVLAFVYLATSLN